MNQVSQTVNSVSKPKTAKKRKRATPKTFKSAFAILKTNANELQQQTEPDIDNLMTTVEESIIAYKVCQERISAVQKALDAAFEQNDSPSQETVNSTS